MSQTIDETVKVGPVGPRGPAGDITAAVHNAEVKAISVAEEGNAAVRKQPKTTSIREMGITKDSSKTEPNSGALKGEAK